MSLLLAGATALATCWIVYSVLWLSPFVCQPFYFRCAGCHQVNWGEQNQIVYSCGFCDRTSFLTDLRSEHIDPATIAPQSASTLPPLLPPVERHR